MQKLAPIALAPLSALVLTVSSISAQDVYVVDQADGPGTDFTTLSAAVSTVLDGDFLLVRAGTYNEELVLDGKGLTIQAEVGALVEVERTIIRNLSSSQQAAVRGIGWKDTNQVNLEISDNLGPVWIEEATASTAFFNWWGGAIVDSKAVVLRRCTFSETPSMGSDPVPQPGLHIVRSEVALYGGSAIGAISGGIGIDGAPGVEVEDSSVTLYDYVAQGGAGSTGGLGNPGGNGGPGILIRGTSDVQTIDTSLTGGAGGISGFSGNGITGKSSVVLGGTLTRLAATARVLDIDSPLRSKAPMNVTLTGVADDRAFLLVDTRARPFSTLTNATGPLVLDPNALLFKMGRIPASGTMTRTLKAPPVISFVKSFYVQGVFLPAAGGIALGTPTQVHVVAASF